MKVCRICLQELNKEDKYLFLDNDESNYNSQYPSVRKKLLICVPELALDIIEGAVLCTTCFNSLTSAYNFKIKCLDTEQKIVNFSEITGCNINCIDISEVAQFNSKRLEYDSEDRYLLSMQYPITQIIEEDSEIDVERAKKDKLGNNLKNTSKHQNLHTKYGVSKKSATQIPFSPELDVEITEYKCASAILSQNQTTGSKSLSNECIFCQKSFQSISELETHTSTHIEQKPFKCTVCEKGFVRKDKLMLHMRVHTGEKPFKCSECGRCFSRKDKLNNHIRTHTGEKPHQCILCQKSFARKDKMNSHMKSQHWLALTNLEITVVKNETNNTQLVQQNVANT